MTKRGRKKKARAKRNHSMKVREAAALEDFLHRTQLFQSSSARQQERHNLLLRKFGNSSGFALPPVDGLPSISAACIQVPQPLAFPVKSAPCQRLCGFLASAATGIKTLLSVLKLEPHDTFYDLGCGDGRVVIDVVRKFGCKGVGVDLAGPLIKQAQTRAKAELAEEPELLEGVTFIQEDIGKMNLDNASAVYVYMPQDALHSLCARVLPCCQLRCGTPIYTEEYWLHDRTALRHCKWKASHWDGQLHCYEWQVAYGLPERSTF